MNIERVKCNRCMGTGQITVDKRTKTCPVCLGQKTIKYDRDAKNNAVLRVDPD